MSAKEQLQNDANAVGLYFDTYSPRYGTTQYKFFMTPGKYFASHSITMMMGFHDAAIFVTGFVQGFHALKNKEENHV